MAKKELWHGPADYQIKVKGNLGSHWSDWFSGMTIESEGTVTTITGKVLDQPALHGLLVRIRDLGLPLICVKRIECEQKDKKPSVVGINLTIGRQKMKKNILIVASFFLLFSVSCSNPKTAKPDRNDRKTYPIIDMHMHSFQWNVYGDPPPPNLITGKRPAARSNTEVMETYIAEMDRHNIVLAVGSGELEMVKMMKNQIPNRFMGGIEFPKYTVPVNKRMEQWPDLNELRRLFESGEMKIMGEITGQYAGAAPDDPRLEPYFALAEEQDIPVCLHTGFGPPMSPYMGDPDFRMRHGNPLLLEDVLVKHPRLRIFIAHGGYPYLEETIALMLMYRQVYVDISAIDWLLTREAFHRYLQRLVQARLGKRILFGTDQMIWPETVGMSIDAIHSATFLSKKQKQNIFFNNAARFLRLDTSKYLLGSSGKSFSQDSNTVEVINSELRLRPATPGDKRTVSFNLELTGVKSTAVQVTGFDIDGVTETEMFINDHKVNLPEEIVADMAPKTATIELENGILKEGENTVVFLFADSVGGTTGFSILGLKVLLRK